jgi:hypothetical protein
MEDTRPVVPFGTDPARYRSYLLRLWREEPSTPWRCQVQCVASGQVRRFEGLLGLFEFLQADSRGEKPKMDARGDGIASARANSECGSGR